MKTVTKIFQNQIEVEKSKFLAILMPLNDAEKFKEILNDLRKEHKKARHVVYAYRVGLKSKSNDDGEPKGTAGRPILEVLTKNNLNNIALFVVRYFGGVKLGAGRLLRTYVSASCEVIKKSEIVETEI